MTQNGSSVRLSEPEIFALVDAVLCALVSQTHAFQDRASDATFDAQLLMATAVAS